MAIRLRIAENGWLVACCAAQTVAKEGDIYLDDAAHYALMIKFTHDLADAYNYTPDPDEYIYPAMRAEENNNPAREQYDKDREAERLAHGNG